MAVVSVYSASSPLACRRHQSPDNLFCTPLAQLLLYGARQKQGPPVSLQPAQGPLVISNYTLCTMSPGKATLQKMQNRVVMS